MVEQIMGLSQTLLDITREGKLDESPGKQLGSMH